MNATDRQTLVTPASALSQARAFIDAAYDHPLSLEQIARVAGFSPYHFLRLFRQTFDETPHQYLTRRRLERAKELLAAGELSVTEVCFSVGFQSLGSFSTLFRRHVGRSPQHYQLRLFRSVSIARQAAPRFLPICYVMMFAGDPKPASDPASGLQPVSPPILPVL